ncbi:MAG: 3-hydroxyacyl-CoA dehydrogenase [Alphaproteobacteria bacterium]
MAEKVGLVGGGLIGRAWAIVFARAGCDVVLYDSVDGAAAASLKAVDALLPDLEAQDLLAGGDAASVRGRMRAATGLADAVDGAVHVQESTPEILEIKREVWRGLDAAAGPDTVLASSTSGLLPSSFTEGLAGGRRCLVAHPINPPFVVPAVELVPAPWTDRAVMERTAALMRRVGQAPIVMGKEIEGFVMNRLQGALLHEAFRLVADGVVGAEDVDIALKDGIGLRWSFMGPFETIDLNAPGGLADYAARYEPLYAGIFPSQTRRVDWVGPLADSIQAERAKKVPRDRLGERALWRDRRLMGLVAHKRAMDSKYGK